MPSNVPIHVATEGLVSEQALTIATDGFIGVDGVTSAPCINIPSSNNIGAIIGDPRREFYIRRDEADALFGPLTYQQANSQARELSDPAIAVPPGPFQVDPFRVATLGLATDLDSLNLATDGFITTVLPVSVAQLVTFLGSSDRGGDPDKDPSRLFIVYYYVAGRQLLGGRAATFQVNRTGSVNCNTPSPLAVPEGQVTLNADSIGWLGVPLVFVP